MLCRQREPTPLLPYWGKSMIELNNIRYTGRGFEAAVVLPTRKGQLTFASRIDGPPTLDPAAVKRELLARAVRKRIRKTAL